MHDQPGDALHNKYFPEEHFKGFGGHKIRSLISTCLAGRKRRVVILSHVNLLLAGWIIKRTAPAVQVILIAHGIEVWKPLSPFKKKMLQRLDNILPVSAYTNSMMMTVQGIDPSKLTVVNNCLDPYLPPPGIKKDPALLQRYGLHKDDIIILTLTRLAATERHKGYALVIKAIASILQQTNAQIKYIIAGKYSADEKEYVLQLAENAGIAGKLLLTGFVADEALAAHFCLADMYVMPSRKEGFGIVFNEAMYYGLPVVAGNVDGSSDALLNGALGSLVNPGSQEETEAAIKRIIDSPLRYVPDRPLLLEHFGYGRYKQQIDKIIANK